MDHNFGLPSAFTTVHAPLPLDQRTHEGRYVWDPRLHSLPQYSTRLCGEGSVNSLPDFSHFSQRRDFANGHVEYSPHYRLSPYMVSSLHATPTFSTPGMGPVDGRVPLSVDALQQVSALHQRSLLEARSSFPGTAGAPPDFSLPLEGSQISSPKVGGRHGRKRALSSSPYSDFDITSVIRFSPNSLVSFMNGSRSSSESGSYGHLSAGSLSPAMGVSPPTVLPHFHQLHHLMRQGLTSPFLLPPTSAISQQQVFSGPTTSTKESAAKGGEATPQTPANQTGKSQSKACEGPDEDKEAAADEPGDFIETNCHWKDCNREFSTQDDLVKHINNDHIHGNKKAFVCRWADCCREEKPFKAQYMLVVHMRRHTGEKPHTCTFEGCFKAYSRLENLKTHLRSHTGEKPYLCEFPGCTKAFSNASDRAKHQNRTHSNEKPYVCKAPGCTKRYTDPSSLRKHVKTVHGPDFYAKKKHKGDEPDGLKDNKLPDAVHHPDDTWGGNTQPPSGVPESLNQDLSKHDNTAGGKLPEATTDGPVLIPIADNCDSTTGGLVLAAEADSCWENEENTELEVSKVEEFAAAITCSLTQGKRNESPSGWMRNTTYNHLKSKGTWLPRVMTSREGCLKSAPSRTCGDFPCVTGGGNETKTYIDLSFPVDRCGSPQYTTLDCGTLRQRRHSSTSTVSTFYGSMTSDGSAVSSRRDSQAAQTPRTMHSSSDPISTGSSRRSSDVSSLSGLSLGALSSLHSQILSTPNITHGKVSPQACSEMKSCCNIQSASIGSPSTCNSRLTTSKSPKHLEKYIQVSKLVDKSLEKSYSGQLASLPPINSPNNYSAGNNNWSCHPNEDIPLELCEEDKFIEENKDLVLPDEMMYYLNKVNEQSSQGNIIPHLETPMNINETYKEDPNARNLFNNQHNSIQRTSNVSVSSASIPLNIQQNRVGFPGQVHCTGVQSSRCMSQSVNMQRVRCMDQNASQSHHHHHLPSHPHVPSQQQFYSPIHQVIDRKNTCHPSGDISQAQTCNSYPAVPNNLHCHQQYFNHDNNSSRQRFIQNVQRVNRNPASTSGGLSPHFVANASFNVYCNNAHITQSTFQGGSQTHNHNVRPEFFSDVTTYSPQTHSIPTHQQLPYVSCCNCNCSAHHYNSTESWHHNYMQPTQKSRMRIPQSHNAFHNYLRPSSYSQGTEVISSDSAHIPKTCNQPLNNIHIQQENSTAIIGDREIAQSSYQSQPVSSNASYVRNQLPLMSTSNMVINDMNSTLSSLMEETRYLKMLK